MTNRQSLSTFLAAEMRFWFISLAVMMLAGAGLAVAPWVERTYFPVLADVRLVDAIAGPATLTFRLAGRKLRDCFRERTDWLAGDPALGGGAPLRSTSPHLPVPLPPGDFVTGEWSLSMPHGVALIYGRVRYDCGWPWTTIQIIGPYTTPGGGGPR